MATFLEAVELDGLLEERVRDALGIGRDVDLGLPFGLHRDVPNRQADQAPARVVRELGPIDRRRLVGIVRVEEHAAKEALVRLAADANRPPRLALPEARGPIRLCDHDVLHVRADHSVFMPPISCCIWPILSSAAPIFCTLTVTVILPAFSKVRVMGKLWPSLSGCFRSISMTW